MNWEELQELAGNIEQAITKIEAVDGVYDEVDACLDGLVWNLLQAWGELHDYISKAVDANELMQGS